MFQNSNYSPGNTPPGETSSDHDPCDLEHEKRRLVDSLEALRRDVSDPRPVPPMALNRTRGSAGKPNREEAFQKLEQALQGQEELSMCVLALYEEANDIDVLQQNLRSSTATCKMHEETIESFENKLLDAISENGKLHQEIDKAQSELMTSKAVSASLARLRDKLRSRNEELRHLGETHRQALAAAEREILYLTARFQEVRAQQNL